MHAISEPQRLAALKRYALDLLPEEAFDRLTRTAARLFQAPMALISLVGARQTDFKSCFGTDLRQTDRALSFCAHALDSPAVVVVPDMTQDARFTAHPLVLGAPHIRFYAGAPLVTPDGHVLGTLCILDTRARSAFSAQDGAALADLAALVMDELELRLSQQGAQREALTRTVQAQHLQDALTLSQLLGGLSDLAALDLPPEELLPPVVDLVGAALDVDWGGLMAVQGDEATLRSHWHRAAAPVFVTRVGAPLRREHGGLLWEAARQSRALFVDDYAGQAGHRTDLARVQGRSVVSVGLGQDGPVTYVMTLARIGRVQPWTARDRQLVQAVIQVVRQSVTQAAGRAALRENQAQLRLALDAAPVVLWSCDMQGRFTLSEGRGLTRLGVQAGELVGQSVREVFARTPAILNHLARALLGERFMAQLAVGEGHYEARYAPLLGEGGQQVGVVGTGYDVTATVLAQRAAVQAREQAEALLELSRVLEADTAPAEVTRTALQAIGRLMPGGWLTLWQRGGAGFVPLAECGEAPATVRDHAGRGLPPGYLDASGVLGGTPVMLTEQQLPAEARQRGLRGAALLPVFLEGPEPLVLAVNRGGAFEQWSAMEGELLAAAARILGAAAGRRRRLEQMEAEARTDTLTGLGNRRAFELDLDAELSRARRQGSAVGVLTIDLDGLKQVNDVWGHARGDALLREFARQLRHGLRAEDRIHRLGGDEYAVVLLGLDDAEVVLERVRAAVEATRAAGFAAADASAGLARYPDDAQEAGELLRLSDARMYADKVGKRASWPGTQVLALPR